MSFEIESPSLFERVIRATIPASDIEARIQKMAKKLAREVNLRGFRKGKIPTNVIVRRFWDHMQADIQADVVNDVYEQIDREQPLTILTEPELEAEPLERGEDFSFKLELMIRPRIEVAGLDGLRHKATPAVVSDEDVDGALKQMREQSAETSEVDQAAGPGLFAEIDATLKQDGQDYLGPLEGHQLEIGKGLIVPGFDEALEGMNAGGEKDFELTLGDDDDGAKMTLACHVSVNKVLRRVLPEIDEAFLEKVGFETEEEMRADIRSKMIDQAEDGQRRQAHERLIGELVEANPIEVPALLIERHVMLVKERMKQEATQRGGEESEELDAHIDGLDEEIREEADLGMQRQVVVESLLEHFEVEAGDEDVDAKLREITEATGMNLARIRALYDNDQHRDRMLNEIRQEKLSAHLLELALENAARGDAEPNEPVAPAEAQPEAAPEAEPEEPAADAEPEPEPEEPAADAEPEAPAEAVEDDGGEA
jgi:trigger factor